MKTMRVILAVSLLIAAGVLAGCNGDDGSDGTPTPSPSPSAAGTAEPSATVSIEEVVTASYLQYWEVYTEALYNLDPSQLSDVMTGRRLERALDEVSNLVGQGRAVEIVVENQPVVVEVEEERAMVFDEYENRSHFIDPQTKESLSSPGDVEVIRDTVTLTLVDGVWKVSDSVRQAE